MAAKNLAKLQKNTFLDKFILKAQESKVCPKKVGLFQFKVGWFKIKARTNLGPQNYMYLSAPELWKQSTLDLHKVEHRTTKRQATPPLPSKFYMSQIFEWYLQTC